MLEPGLCTPFASRPPYAQNHVYMNRNLYNQYMNFIDCHMLHETSLTRLIAPLQSLKEMKLSSSSPALMEAAVPYCFPSMPPHHLTGPLPAKIPSSNALSDFLMRSELVFTTLHPASNVNIRRQGWLAAVYTVLFPRYSPFNTVSVTGKIVCCLASTTSLQICALKFTTRNSTFGRWYDYQPDSGSAQIRQLCSRATNGNFSVGVFYS
jgi:hypothetical protein